jgi:primosomal protein N'
VVAVTVLVVAQILLVAQILAAAEVAEVGLVMVLLADQELLLLEFQLT